MNTYLFYSSVVYTPSVKCAMIYMCVYV